MARNYNVQDYAPMPLSACVTARLMPDQDVSERTDTTRRIGAQQLMNHLIAGEWGGLHDFDKTILGSCLRRIITNAERQGVEVIYPVVQAVNSFH